MRVATAARYECHAPRTTRIVRVVSTRRPARVARSPFNLHQYPGARLTLELTGKITHVLPEKSGTSSRGPWRKQEFVIEIPGDYPKQVCFMVWGDKIDQFEIEEGQELTVHFDLESREYNGRWYTDVKAWRVDRSGQGGEAGAPQATLDEQPPASDDDVPF